uniref:Uncharacterized protein n=1 Tax=Rhizophora mucronata TaxID=61149 RepID=A0A2P2NRD3_RHIMU
MPRSSMLAYFNISGILLLANNK